MVPDFGDLIREIVSNDRNIDLDLASEEDLEKEWKKKIHTLKESRYKKDTWIRIALAISTQLIIMAWVVLTFVLLFKINNVHPLSDAVICAFLGTGTANLVGLAAIILNGFFKYMKQDVDLEK